MKKILKVFLIFVIVLNVSGCNSETTLSNKTEDMSDAILEFYHDINYDISKLPADSVKLLEELKQEELSGKKSINLTKNNLYTVESYTTEKNSNGVYLEKGDYYVYYKDLDFSNRDEEKRYYAVVNVDNKVAVVYKDEWPIMYRMTENNINYKYRYMDRVKTEDSIIYYFRSYGNASGLMITYHLSENEIKDISLDYERHYSHEVLEVTEETNDYSMFVFLTIIVLLVGAFIYYLIKKCKNVNRINDI